MIGRKIDKERRDGTSPEALNKFFTEFQRVKAEFQVTPSNIWNFDEQGTAIGASSNGLVMASSQKKRTHCKASGEREWVTTIECVSAVGARLQPLIIFKGQSLQAQWFPAEDVPDWHYTYSTNGWTSNLHGLHWLDRIFIPATTPRHVAEPRILICDGHGSHASVEFMYAAFTANIQLVFLPPHSSHVLQPLDINYFGIMKSRYRKEVEFMASLRDDLKIKKRQFITCYKQARGAIQPQQIIRAFAATGIHPFHPERAKSSSQVTQPVPTPLQSLSRPTTPPGVRRSTLIIKTPTRSHDVLRCLTTISLTSLPTVRNKVARAMASKDVQIATLSREIKSLKRQLDTYTGSSKRVRVQCDIQSQFADIVAIKNAQEQQRALEAESALRASRYQHQNSFYINDAVTKEEHDAMFKSMCLDFEYDKF
jgi:hypothetical protein